MVSPGDVPFTELGGDVAALGSLDSARPANGFFWQEYSPASPQGRMYFTEENAQRIDGARKLISDWKVRGLLRRDEYALLIADLITAAARVANIAGTYGGFLALDRRGEASTAVRGSKTSRDTCRRSASAAGGEVTEYVLELHRLDVGVATRMSRGERADSARRRALAAGHGSAGRSAE